MVTLSQLKKQNEALRKKLRKQDEVKNLGRERIRLLKENRNLAFAMKHKNLLTFAKQSQRIGGKFWKKLQEMEKTRLRNEALQKRLSKKRKRR